MNEATAGEKTRGQREAFFEARKQDVDRQRQVLDRKCRLLSDVRLGIFGAFLTVPILVWRGIFSSAWLWLLLPLGVAFWMVAIRHDRLLFQREKCGALGKICEACSRRSALIFDGLPKLSPTIFQEVSGKNVLKDLDVVGEKSLIRLVDRTSTAFGAKHLVRLFLGGKDIREACRQQEAIRELLEMREFRESLEVVGLLCGPTQSTKTAMDLAVDEQWLQESAESLRPDVFFRRASQVLPPIWLTLFLLWGIGLMSPIFWAVFGGIQAILALAFSRSSTAIYLSKFRTYPRANAKVMAGMGELFSQVEGADFHSEKLRTLQCAVKGAPGVQPSKAFARLSGILSALKLLDQPLFHLPLAALFFFDVHMAQAAWRWSEGYGRHIPHWMAALGELEALSSLAGYADTLDSICWPRFSERPVFSAKALGHPLIRPSSRITNDVCLGKNASQIQALVVTGSNMAGKTTFLRSMGINGLLALAGGPVCAQSLEIGALPVVTSMRITDSLEDGLSLFHAEVRHMRSLLDASAKGPVLFLLDEILHGTNTTERQRASRAILHALVARGAIGAVATHDVALSTMEKESNGRIQNVHFTDTYDGQQLRFDYRLRLGPVSSSNALLVMAQEGIFVESLERES